MKVLNMVEDYNLIAILGPTATGKTNLAVSLAKKLKAEIISADSRQVYRGLDIGSGKDLKEYGDIPYHLIDIVDPDYEYNVFDFQKDFYQAFKQVTENKSIPILAGGSALYVDSVLNGYRMLKVDENRSLRKELNLLNQEQLAGRLLKLKPEQHNTTDLIEPERIIRAIEIAEAELKNSSSLPPLPKITPFIFALSLERSRVRENITTRLKQRFEDGMIDEVETLINNGVSLEKLDFLGLEYRFIAKHLKGQLDSNELFELLNTAIHQFAKKQHTWLRRVERKGHIIHWIDLNNPNQSPLQQAMEYLEIN